MYILKVSKISKEKQRELKETKADNVEAFRRLKQIHVYVWLNLYKPPNPCHFYM